MFHTIKLEPIRFVSNPPLQPILTVEPTADERGDASVHFVVKDQDNASPFAGLKYNPDTMSLRAKVRLGLPLQRVNFDVVENDPAVLQRKMIELAQVIDYNVANRQSTVALAVQPSNPE